MPEEDLDMEEAMDGEEEGENEKKKGGLPIMMIIIIVVGLAVLGGGGFLGYTMFFAEPDAQAEESAASEEDGDKEDGDKAGGAPAPGTVITLNPFIVNLADPTGKRYLKLALAVDARDEVIKAEVEARLPQIRDSILILLTSKTFADISTVAGKIRLRNEVLKIFNRILGAGSSVHAIYFTEFVIQ